MRTERILHRSLLRMAKREWMKIESAGADCAHITKSVPQMIVAVFIYKIIALSRELSESEECSHICGACGLKCADTMENSLFFLLIAVFFFLV